ncbi:MAG: methyltransferase [Planctomycetes bacterium]|nr:methyltransferase [Planctomycetota bacterium]
MTGRERIAAAMAHREADVVPIDFSAHRSSGIAALAYPKLRAALGLEPRPVRVYDIIQQLAIVDEDVLDRFGVDTIELGRGFSRDEADWAEWVLPDGTPCLVPAWSVPRREDGRWVLYSPGGRELAAMPDGVLYFEQTYYPYYERDDDPAGLDEALGEGMWSAIASPPGPGVDDEALAAGARALRDETDRAIVGLFGGNLLEAGQWLYRMDKFMLLLAAEPKRIHRFLDALTEFHLANLERYLSAVGDCIDVIAFGDDLGMQRGPQISPAMYREFFKPRHAAMWRRAKELADVKVMLHSCGDVRAMLPDLIDAGLDAINPVQISCPGMDAARLKAEFGRDIVFWGGGCDTQVVLANASPDAVAEHVRRQVATLAPGGGFVFQQVHNVLADVPAENIIAMFDAVRAGH